MSTTTSALALNTKAAKAINPPAKKSEIIEALAIRKHGLLTEQAAKDKAAYGAAMTELYRLACDIKNASDAPKYITECVGDCRCYNRPHISLSVKSFYFYVDEFTPEMKVQLRIMERIEKAGTRSVPDLSDIKRSIRDAMNGELSSPAARVQALLADPSTVKALDKTLNRLDEAASKSIAA